MRRIARLGVACALMVMSGVVGGVTAGPAAAALDARPSAFQPLAPTRLVDTRTGAAVAPEATLHLDIAALANLPAGAVAVALNVTVTQALQPGFVTVWPGLSQARPTVSNLNVERAGQTVANAVIAPLSADGSIDVFHQPGGHLLVDISGVWVAATSATSGRLVMETSRRALDTRSAKPVTAGSITHVSLGATAAGASAALVNVTATRAGGAGFLSLWPTGSPRPTVSTLNVERAGQTVANLAVVPVDASGSIDVYSDVATDVLIDVFGLFTGTGVAVSTNGLLVPVEPQRIFDSRDTTRRPLYGYFPQTVPVGGTRGIPPSIGAAVLNVTATEASLATWVSVIPSGGKLPPETSNLNVDRSYQTIPNLVVSQVGEAGFVELYTPRTTHAIVDVFGYFTGVGVPPSPHRLPSDPGDVFPSGDAKLRKIMEIGGAISPKSVVTNGTGLFFAQNMMYTHTITVYDREGGLVATIPDRVGTLQGSPVEAAAAPGGRQMYVSNYAMYGPGAGPEGFDACTTADAIADSTVYRLSGLTIDQVIPVGKVPKFLAVSPNGRWLAVTNWCGEDVSIVDTATAKEVRRVHVGRNPRGVVITPDSTKAHVALMGEGRVATIDLVTGASLGKVAVGAGARHLNLSSDGRWLYVTLNEEGGVAKVDTTTMRVVARVATGNQPRTAVLSADDRYLYVVNYLSSTASKVRTDDMVVVDSVPTAGNPIGITYDDEANQLWVSCYVGKILVFTDAT